MKSANEHFSVGAIVYFISSKTEQVIPALVSEKIVRTSMENSSKVTYVLQVRSGKNLKSVEVDPAAVDLFATPEEIKAFMIERTTKAIDGLVSAAVEASRTFVPASVDQKLPVPSEGEYAEVVLEGGQVAKLRM